MLTLLPCRTFESIVWAESLDLNGCWPPVTVTKKRTPAENMSLLLVQTDWVISSVASLCAVVISCKTSGAINWDVPLAPLGVNIPPVCVVLLRPKSPHLTTVIGWETEIRTLAGLISRWTNLLECMCCNPLASWRRIWKLLGKGPRYFFGSVSGRKTWSRDAAHSSNA